MAYKTVKASWLVEKFRLMLAEHWPYVAGAARYGAVDCSGAFSYWYAQAGSYCPHGSNSMIRTWCVRYGKVGEIDLKPGMAVFRWSNDGNEPEKYKSDGLGNFRHVGLYVGDGKTIEAKDTATGIYEGKISQWHYAAELRYTNYDLSEGGSDVDAVSGADAPAPIAEEPEDSFEPFEGVVQTDNGGSLNLRKEPVHGTIRDRIPNGTHLDITEKRNDWYRTSYNGQRGWVSARYIVEAKPPFYRQLSVDVYDENKYNRLIDWLQAAQIDFYIGNGDD